MSTHASHSCGTLIIHCMDFRLQPKLVEFRTAQGLDGNVDILSIAGAARDLAQEGMLPTEGILKNVAVAVEKHSVKDIHLINHTDCGAYGGSAAFSSADEEWRRHVDDLHMARAVLLKRFPQLTVHLHIAVPKDVAGAWQVSIESVE